MLKILFIEDIPDSLNDIIEFLKDNADVECVQLFDQPANVVRRHATGEELFAAANRMFTADPELSFDLVCLDISFAHDAMGGIRLFNRLAREGFRQRWERTAVLSGHVKQGVNWWDDHFAVDDNHDPIAFAIALWADTALVPNRNLINKGLARGNVEKYAQLLVQIATL